MKVVFIEVEELRHILKEEAFLCSCKGTTSFTVCGMKGSAYLLLRIPINTDVDTERNNVVERLVSALVSCMITVDSNYQTVWEINVFKFGAIEINTQGMECDILKVMLEIFPLSLPFTFKKSENQVSFMVLIFPYLHQQISHNEFINL